ncbi:MAG: ERCC4 domain-containing protein [Eubacteriales bacterium]|nr:ERCC4 domain-containing protein [Eubacteriales bacterium]
MIRMMSCRSELHPSEIEDELKTLTLVCDTREHDTTALRRRLEGTGLPVIREKLDFADYSCKTEHFDFTNCFAIERKMSIDEVAQNLTRGRKRFAHEFERAKAVNARVYLLIENGSWEAIFGHKYRTLVHPNALIASLFTWQARYNAAVLFCRPETTPMIIREVLMREVRHELEQIASKVGD